ncbi:MAG TPA: PilN domain-containing protein [Vicinamibacterales bacterium]|jgi:Tfp pilus assembly protein PilN|nr:PilN domain-containing protein [Vicinamibacterales bacterium]
MIRANLSTRPFYNERAVRLWLAVIAFVVLAATILNVSELLHYSKNETDLALRASQDESAARDLRARAAGERASVDTKQIEIESTRAREANNLIDRRTFSWTEVFNRFEATLPDDVRVTSVHPTLDKERQIQLGVTVIARSVEDVDTFMENLEATGAFVRLNPAATRLNEQGQWESVLTMRYVRAQ